MTLRKVLCVSLADNSAQVVNHLRIEGWEVLIAADLAAAQRLQGHPSVQVGLLLLGNLPADRFNTVEEFLRLSRATEWVGVIPPEGLDLPVLRELVLNYFFDYHTMPLGVWAAEGIFLMSIIDV